MSSETKTCQSCKTLFVIDQEDIDFYGKIQVPPPTFCPSCRAVRRMTWRNERTLYRRACEKTGKQVITCFAPDSGIHVYDRDVWWSDDWDPLSFGTEYDFSKPFFSQFRELLGKIPMPSVFNSRCVRSDYGNHNGELKDSYLVFATWGGENLLYSSKILGAKDSSDLLVVNNSELCYEAIGSSKLYRVIYAENCENCSDSYFLYECRGCNNCFGCTNLRNKSYHIFNRPYSRDEYLETLKGFNLGSAAEMEKFKAKFEDIKKNALRKYANIVNSQNATGDNLTNVSNCRDSFDISNDVRDCRYCINGGMKMYDAYDGYGLGANAELLYESVDTGADGNRFYFDIFVWTGNDVAYSYACHGCQNCFGCIGLRKKEYCILNKQYTKEEYKELVPRIINQMEGVPYVDKKGMTYRYGEFFPSELSPFAYNETIAQEYFPLSREEVTAGGYIWREEETKHYSVTKKSEELPDAIRDTDDSIVNEIIGCAHASSGGCNEKCSFAFKIIPEELMFYRKMNLPLPRLCSNCRHFGRMTRRNPVRLWRRRCTCDGRESEISLPAQAGNKELGDKSPYRNTTPHFHDEKPCPNEFDTPYAPDRPEAVYCEQCYQSEVV